MMATLQYFYNEMYNKLLCMPAIFSLLTLCMNNELNYYDNQLNILIKPITFTCRLWSFLNIYICAKSSNSINFT